MSKVMLALALGAALLASCGGSGGDGRDAQVSWTAHGLVHVKATNYDGLGYGYGYAVARDQLCLLADRIHTLRGARSEHFGAAGTALVGFLTLPNVDSDLFYRLQLSDAEVDEAWQQLSPKARALAEGYAAGYNRYRGEAGAAAATRCAGVQPPAMTAQDVVRATMQVGTLWKAFLVAPAASASVWSRLDAQAPAAAPAVSPPVLAGASNAWAFGADATQGGGGLMVANPHTFWQDHWLAMHQMHLTIPGEIDVMGADFLGLPVPLAGFTRHVAWSIEAPSTITYPLLVALRRTTGAGYVVDGQGRTLQRRTVQLKVRGTDGVVATRDFDIPWSHLGPVYQLPAQGSRPAGWYAVADPNQANARGLDQFIAVARARNTAEVQAALAAHRGVTAHIIAADRDGTALYAESGPLLDVSDAQLAGCALAPGALDGGRAECALRDGEGRPRLAPAARLPMLGTRGVVHNANDNYTHAVFGARHDGYPLLLGSALAEPNPRTRMSHRQLEGLLAGGGRVDAAEATDLIFSNRSYVAETLLDDVIAACRAAPAAAGVAGACDMLAAWDRRYDATSRGALLFALLWERLAAVPGLYAQPFDAARPFEVRRLSPGAATQAAVVDALQKTTQALQALGLRGDEPWGRMLARATATGQRVALHGGPASQGVLNAMTGVGLGADGYAAVVQGSAYIHVVSWNGDKPVARMLVANGQSADPASPHRDDQLDLFARKALFTPPFTDEEIAADPALRTLRLRE